MRVLYSIHPEHAEKILAGEKMFEYRRKIFKRQDVSSVVIYATHPVGRVVGEFEISEVVSDEPTSVWRQTSRSSGIESCLFDQYFSGCNVAYAIGVKCAKRYREPLPLSELFPSVKSPPQSFIYVA